MALGKILEEQDVIISPFQGFLCFAFHVTKGFTLR